MLESQTRTHRVHRLRCGRREERFLRRMYLPMSGEGVQLKLLSAAEKGIAHS